MAIPRIRLPTFLLLGATGLVWLLLAADGRYHWDEPGYLYTACYDNISEILNPNGAEYVFESSRMLHLVLAHVAFRIFGPGLLTVDLIAWVYFLMLAASVYCGYLALQSLLTFERSMLIGINFFCFAPVVVWLAFKTLPELPATFCLSLSILSLIRSLERSSLWWIVLGAAALACLALTRNALALGFAAFSATLVLFGGYRYPLKRVLINTLVMGGLSLVFFAAMLTAFGISLMVYLSAFSLVMEESSPIIVRLYTAAMEGGALFLAIPLAFCWRLRKEALFLTVWFVLATLPVYIFLSDIETRYLIANLIPLMGLTCLAVAGVMQVFSGWTSRPWFAATSYASVVSLLALIAGVAQPIMEHEVIAGEMRHVIAALERRYGQNGFTLLTPWEVSDFQYLRVAYPKLAVYSVHQPSHEQLDSSAAQLKQRYGRRHLTSVDELRQLKKPLLYYGVEKSPPVTNLGKLAGFIPFPALRTKINGILAKAIKRQQFTESWMWDNSRFRFTPVLRLGHYRADEVTILPVGSTEK